MPRLFTALEIPHDIALDLDILRGGVEGARWIDRDSLHLTLRFAGDIGDREADELCHGLDGVHGYEFSLRLKGMGAFGGAKPRSIWVGVERSEALLSLQADIETVCRRVGLAPEARQFTPHVTLARLKGSRVQSAETQTFVSRHGLYESRPFDVTRFVLMSSRPSRGGGPYVTEEEFELDSMRYAASP